MKVKHLGTNKEVLNIHIKRNGIYELVKGAFVKYATYRDFLFNPISIFTPTVPGFHLSIEDGMKRMKAALGPELVVNGGFDSNSGWTLSDSTITISDGKLRFQATTNTYITASSALIGLLPGKTYVVTATIDTITSGAVQLFIGGATPTPIITSTQVGKITGIFTVPDNAVRAINVARQGSGVPVFVIDNISVKEIDLTKCTLFQDSAATIPVTGIFQPLGYIKDLSGNNNHFYQPSNTGSRPIVSRRVNLLLNSENTNSWQIANGASISGNSMISPAVPSGDAFLARSIAVSQVATSTSFSTIVRFKKPTEFTGFYSSVWLIRVTGGTTIVSRSVFNPYTGDITFSDLDSFCTDSGEYLDVHVNLLDNGTANTSLQVRIYPCYNTNGSSSRSQSVVGELEYVRADVRYSSDFINMPEYQRVGELSSDYDEEGFPAFVDVDGVDDWWESVNTLDMSSTDAVMLVAAVRKDSDAAAGVVFELGTSTTAPGSMALRAPHNAAANFSIFSTGSIAGGVVSPANYPAPYRAVLTGISRISTDTAILRVNGAEVASSTADQGTGNYGNYKAYLFRRGGSTLPFKGRFYGITCSGLNPSNSLISSIENWYKKTYKIQ